MARVSIVPSDYSARRNERAKSPPTPFSLAMGPPAIEAQADPEGAPRIVRHRRRCEPCQLGQASRRYDRFTVLRQRVVDRHERQSLDASLGDKDAIEGVAMHRREGRNGKYMPPFYRNLAVAV